MFYHLCWAWGVVLFSSLLCYVLPWYFVSWFFGVGSLLFGVGCCCLALVVFALVLIVISPTNHAF
jgi:hypothetical protein